MKRIWTATFAVLLLIVSSTTLSGATFTSSSTNPNSVFSTAASFQLQVSLANPGTPLRGSSVALTATASDTGGSTVNNVTFQRSPAGANTWTNICAPDTSSPYTCTFNTTAVADGLYDLRAVVTNSLGATSDAIVVNRLLDNTAPTGTVGDPGAWFGGTITLGSTVSDASPGSGVTQVRYEYKTTAGSTWTTACTANASPWTCAFNASGLTTNTAYDFRAVVTDGAGNSTTSAAVTNRRADNTIPSGAALTDPGTPLAGTITLAGTAADANSGIQTTRMQVSPAGANTWSNACTDTTSPYSCSFDTTTIADGLYDMRLQAVDVAGNIRNSGLRTNRRIDNSAPQLTFTDPGQYLVGTSTRTATATDSGSGVRDVQFQYRQQGTSTWATWCTDGSSPYSCNTNTTSVADGLWEWRAVATDNAGLTATSTVYTSRIDNTAPAVTQNVPGAPLSGVVSIATTPSDIGAGLATVTIEYRGPNNVWTSACVLTQAPWTCDINTASLPDGDHDFRTTAVDAAGNTTVTTIVNDRRVDNNAPTGLTVSDPGAWISGLEALTGTAVDGAGMGVTSVAFQYAPAGTSLWTTACTDPTPAYTCNLDTTALVDGAFYDLRILATDGAGHASTSALVANRRVDNSTPTGVVMTDPGSPRTGVVTFGGTASDALSGVATVAYQYWTGTTWATMCTANAAPWTCAYDTSARADGAYDLRALATDQVGNAIASATVPARVLDNGDPSVTMIDPGQYLRGAVTFGATASDGGSGVANVTIQRSPANANTWSDVCAPDATAPYGCTNTDTTTWADGLYDLRAVVVDGVGRTKISASRNDRYIDNSAPTVALADPGTPRRGTVALSATSTDVGPSGVASVTIERSPAGAGTWTTICVDTSSAYGCNWDTTLAADGAWDLRAISADNAGNTTISSITTGRQTDNTKPAGADVQATDGGGIVGLLQAGDSITLTYTEPVDPATVVAGWNGISSQPIAIRLNNNAANDRLLFYNAANSTALALTAGGGVTLGADHVAANMVWAGTLTRSGSSFTVTFGSITSGALIGTPTGGATLTWSPDKAVTDPAGNPADETVVSEGGAADPNF